jgi:hypothetical protein
MKKFLRTSAVILAVLFITVVTVSAQDKKQVEKKIRIITLDDKGAKKDTTIITSDTIGFNADEMIVNTGDGRMIRRMGKDHRIVIVNSDSDAQGMMPGPMMRNMRGMGPGPEAAEGVMYHISVDGVTVNIRAPMEKSKEADQILEAVRNILMKK